MKDQLSILDDDSFWGLAERPEPVSAPASFPVEPPPALRSVDALLRAERARSGGGVREVVVKTLGEDERIALGESSTRRGVMAWESERGKVRRSVAEASALDAFCAWLASAQLDTFFSVTYSDKVAKSRHVGSVKSARFDVVRQFNDFGCMGPLVLSVERTDRDVPHVHGVLRGRLEDFPRLRGAERPLLEHLFRHFKASCGRSRFEPVRDQNEATLYALKDSFKRATSDDALYLRLRPRVGYRNAGRVDVSEQDAIFSTLRARRRRAGGSCGSAEVDGHREGCQVLETPRSRILGRWESANGEHDLTAHSQ